MITIVSHQQALKIIDTRKPEGLFLVLNPDEVYTGIDNTTADAWTEDFKDLRTCLKYLHGCSLEELGL